ncbi:radical SAM protein [Chloroflexi bacterium TSY]|nr:radical SAM protein [Chloroflexi bacterium TSY]
MVTLTDYASAEKIPDQALEPELRQNLSEQIYKPSLVSWNLTKKCNLRCPHCYMEGGKAAENELTTAECLALIDDMKDLGTEMLILTGGEPLLRRDIYDIARYASSRGIWVVMGTNGVLITEPVVQKMLECGVKGVAISIDSLDPKKHNSFRGGPNAWEYSVRALEICRAQGLQVLVQTTVMDINYDEIPDLMKFTKELGAWSFNLYFLVQTGRGQKMNDLSPEQTESMLSYLVDVQDQYRPMLVRSKCAPQFKQIAYEKGLGGLESGGCMAGTQYCRIMPQGDVTPCPYMTLVAGNVREQSFREIWETAPELLKLRDVEQLKGRCGSCEFSKLCGGCRCRAYAAYDDYLQEDPACRYQPTGRVLETVEIIWNDEAQARLERIPISFIRSKVKQGLEAYAQRKSISVITPDIMKEAMTGEGRPQMFKNVPSFFRAESTQENGD